MSFNDTITSSPRVASLSRISLYLLIYLSVIFIQTQNYKLLAALIISRLVYIFVSKWLFSFICIVTIVYLINQNELLIAGAFFLFALSLLLAYASAISAMNSGFTPILHSSHSELSGTSSILSFFGVLCLILSIITNDTFSIICAILFGIICIFTILPGLIFGRN